MGEGQRARSGTRGGILKMRGRECTHEHISRTYHTHGISRENTPLLQTYIDTLGWGEILRMRGQQHMLQNCIANSWG